MDINGVICGDLYDGKKIFPLQTQQSLAERWNTSRQNVARMAKNNINFPKPLEGIIEQTDKPTKVYALCDIIKYEELRGLKK